MVYDAMTELDAWSSVFVSVSVAILGPVYWNSPLVMRSWILSSPVDGEYESDGHASSSFVSCVAAAASTSLRSRRCRSAAHSAHRHRRECRAPSLSSLKMESELSLKMR